ncbi:hypothetical protein chiPu_0021247 [Chiloscyllium punctatum]|uniref:Uncharacterized protein n=1 Tax=Chiloscyllium punctatum TaxID=137246 RepID=A0A401RPH5_CHIPU|nr:hypothetical protein [Chiloscyllium punctatum]
MRLGREVRSLDGLRKQVNCYLVGINCLRQIRSEYAWIVRPVCGATYERPGASPKRSYDGELTAPQVCHQIDIVELKDLEKEFVLARTRLLLAKHDPCSAAIAGSASAEEMVALLVQVGLFDAAVSLCQTFRLSLNPIFEGLSFKCIKLQLIGEAAQSDAWDWLKANQIPSIIATKESRYNCSKGRGLWWVRVFGCNGPGCGIRQFLTPNTIPDNQRHGCYWNTAEIVKSYILSMDQLLAKPRENR